MDFFEVVRKRHSYRESFIDAAVPRDDLVKIVEAGLLAPSGKNCQTTRFVIVDEPALTKQISAMHTSNKAFQQAKAYIMCVVDKEPEAIYEGFSFEVEDCAAAVENMLLAITALGYASVWIDGWLRVEDRAAKIGTLLGIPDDKYIRIVLPVGVPAVEKGQPAKMGFSERACFNRYEL